MSFQKTVDRLVVTSHDFSIAGMGLIGYYLRLYVVDLILAVPERTEKLTADATTLLDQIEEFKNTVNAAGDEEDSASLKALLEDRTKAKTYLLNFVLSLYNQKLAQLKTGPFDVDLKRALWCCHDLFGCIMHLWENSIDDIEPFKKKQKYCKFYLSKLTKGEIQSKFENDKQEAVPQPTESLDVTDFILPVDSTTTIDEATTQMETIDNELTPADDPIEQTDHVETKSIEIKEVDESSPVPNEELEKLSKEIDNLELKEEDPAFTLPEAPSTIPPDFLDESEDEIAPPPTTLNKSVTKSHDDIKKIMDRTEAIEEIQKRAKFAISALNYDDIVTAKKELTQALALLKLVEQ